MASILEIIVKLDDQASEKAKGIGDKLGDIGKSATKTGLKLTAGLTLPLGAMALKGIDAASDLDESMNKVSVVFGDNAGAILDWSTDAASAMGMTQQAALEASGTYGNLFRALGLNVDVSQDMSMNLVQLAADLGSFNNAAPLDVLEALRAGITGETEPLKRFGINLNQAGLEAKAMAMGLIESKDQLTPATKAQAAYALILEQTSLAQGDFARTSDGLANSQRILKAQVGDMLAELGANFLPIVTQVVQKATELLTAFQNLSPELKNTILIVGLVVAGIGPLLIIVGTLINAIAAIIPVVSAVGAVLSGPLLLVLLAVGAGIALLALAWKNNWGDIQGKTQAAVDWIKDTIQKFLKLITDWWNKHKDEILNTVRTLWNIVQNVFTVASNIVQTVVSFLLKVLTDWWNKYGDDFIELVTLMWNIVKGVFQTVTGIIQTVVSTFIALVTGFWRTHKDEITTIVQTLWNVLKIIIEGVSNIIGGIIKAFIALIKGDWEGFGEALRSIWDTAWNTIKGVVETITGGIMKVITGLISDAKSAFLNTDWAALGRSIVDGVIQGAKNIAGKLKDTLIGIAKGAWEAAKAFIGKGSPAKLFIPLGESIPMGIIKGIENYSQNLERATVRGVAKTSTITTHFHITANYPYQTEKSLKSDIKRLNALYVGGYR